MEKTSHQLFSNCPFETGSPKPFAKSEPKPFKKNYVPSETPAVTKSGLKSDSSKQVDAKINQKILRDYFLSDPLIRAALQTDVDNVCAGFYFEREDDSPEAEEQEERAKELFYRDNFMEKWRNLQLCLGVYDDAYQEVQPFLNDGEIKFNSYVVETPSIEIKNKKNGEIDYYSQKLDGKEVAKIKPENMIHYRFNAFGDRDYGLSLVSTVLYSSAIRKFIEKYNAAIFANHKPRGVWTFPGEMSKELYDENVDLIIEGKTDPNKDLFMRGTNIDYKNFLDQTDVDFMKGYIEARNEILVGLGVPPIMLCLPEGSNKANGDTQLQSYDRRVIAKQNAYAYKVNTELLPKIGLDKIKFVCKKASKRDEERELNIVNKMKGLVTLNEARKEIGYPELDVSEFPQADQIWSDNANLFGAAEEPAPGSQEQDKQIAKSLKVKKKVKAPLVPLKKEAEAIKPIKQFYAEAISLAKKQVDLLAQQGKFKKSKSDNFKKALSDDLMSQLTNAFNNAGLGTAFATFVKDQYMETGNKLSTSIGKNFQPNQDELNFIKDYNFDLIKTQSQRELAKIKQTLEVGFLNNQSATAIKQALDKIRETAQNQTKTLVRTEMNRANNMGSLNAMKEAGVKTKKYIQIVDDKRTSPISKAFAKKYGSEAQAIDLDKEFKVIVKGKTYRGLAPPFHPNDRDVLVYMME